MPLSSVSRSCNVTVTNRRLPRLIPVKSNIQITEFIWTHYTNSLQHRSIEQKYFCVAFWDAGRLETEVKVWFLSLPCQWKSPRLILYLSITSLLIQYPSILLIPKDPHLLPPPSKKMFFLGPFPGNKLWNLLNQQENQQSKFSPYGKVVGLNLASPNYHTMDQHTHRVNTAQRYTLIAPTLNMTSTQNWRRHTIVSFKRLSDRQMDKQGIERYGLSARRGICLI